MAACDGRERPKTERVLAELQAILQALFRAQHL
jgi:hypothetical protein